jgi:NAD dependent epimerase/dehydratase family enzyme
VRECLRQQANILHTCRCVVAGTQISPMRTPALWARVRTKKQIAWESSLACRWNARIKREIKDSRVAVTRRIAAAINGIPKSERPKVLVNSSAVGFYGVSGDEALNEASRSGSDYLAQVCCEWEAAASEANTRVVILRTGIVLSKAGGALAKMIPVFSMFGGPFRCT